MRSIWKKFGWATIWAIFYKLIWSPWLWVKDEIDIGKQPALCRTAVAASKNNATPKPVDPDEQGCQSFRGTVYQNRENIPKSHKIYQGAIKYIKRHENWPNSHKVYQHLPLQDPPKFTQIGIFGLNVNRLATLSRRIG
jgi:hypothetical protein